MADLYRMNVNARAKRDIVKVLIPAPSELEQKQVLLSCGHTLWVPGTRDRTAYCSNCPPPTRRSFRP